jgi:methionyl aminopeptidase
VGYIKEYAPIRLKTEEQLTHIQSAAFYLREWLNRAIMSVLNRSAVNTYQIEESLRMFVHQTPGDRPRLGLPFVKAANGSGAYGFGCCVSINDEVVHCRPDGYRPINVGDLVKIDAGISADGWCADMARTAIAAEDTAEDMCKDLRLKRDLISCSRAACKAAIDAAKATKLGSEISKAIYDTVKLYKFDVIRNYAGHGIGQDLHEPPLIPNDPACMTSEVKLYPGLVICLEPMVASGSGKIVIGEDGWAVKTADGSLAAHHEDMIAIMPDGSVKVLT